MFNIIILNIDNLPNFNTTTQITSSIMFQTNLKTTKYFYLLYDKGHYSPILDIKQFLNVRGFCGKCQHTFTNISGLQEHTCDSIEQFKFKKSNCNLKMIESAIRS